MSAERARINVLAATADDRPLLEELFQFYRYDFSEFTGEEVGPDGRYPAWERMPAYFSEPERFPFLVRIGDSIAGFALLRRCAAEDGGGDVTDMAEFFIMRKFRRRGVGEHVATALFGRFPGRWQVRERHDNLPAQLFWRRIIGRYTGGRFDDQPGDAAQKRGPVQYFISPRGG